MLTSSPQRLPSPRVTTLTTQSTYAQGADPANENLRFRVIECPRAERTEFTRSLTQDQGEIDAAEPAERAGLELSLRSSARSLHVA